MTEREMFEEWFTENIDDDVDFDKYDNSDDSPYFDGLVNATWKAWQASANREGYKLVPVKYIDTIYDELQEHDPNYPLIFGTLDKMIGATP